MGKLLPRSFERLRSVANKSNRQLYQRRGGGAAGVTAAKFPKRIIYLSAGWHWLRAVPRHQRRHELAASRHWRQRHLNHEWIVSHHPAQAASAVRAGRGTGGESSGVETGSPAAGGRRAIGGSRAGVRAGRANIEAEKIP
jgi:hypothetical protein